MIELRNVSVQFEQKQTTIQAVKEATVTIEQGEIFGMVGYSGAGKSTLVRVINLLQRPTSGEIWIKGENYTVLKEKTLRQKRKRIGMIFQHFNLMMNRTIAENVAFSLKYTGIKKAERQEKVKELLALVGLSEKSEAYPRQLSGGQKQRVAIARALANDPEILLCDEATSALDPRTTLQILALLKELNRRLGLTIVLITHEMQVIKEICDRVAVMADGRILEQGPTLQIFQQPRETFTKEFVRTATHIDQVLATIRQLPEHQGETLYELSYIGESTSEPLIAKLYSQYQVATNILYGNVEFVQEQAVGNLIVRFAGATSQVQKAIHTLQKQGVQVQALLAAEKPNTETVQAQNETVYVQEGGQQNG